MAHSEFTYILYKRKSSSTKKKVKPVYYAKVYEDNGHAPEYRVSTGQTSKSAAIDWLYNHLEERKEERIRKEREKHEITFSQLADGFWDIDGAYAKDKRARLRTVSNGFLDSRRGTMNNQVLPKWGKYKLTDLTASKIDRWVLDMASDNRIAPASVNQRLQIMKVMLEEACKRGYLQENPARFVKPVADRATPRGVLSFNEVKKLLNPHIWNQYRHYAINLLTLSTGLRISEVRGLQVHQVHPDYIEVHTAWEEHYGLKEPKCGSTRDLPITDKVYKALRYVIETTKATDLVFYGKEKTTPLSKTAIEKNLYRTMARIGIDDAERRRRNITFHSHRHTLNTLMRSAGISDPKIRMMTGHREASMTERYTHFRMNDLKDISTLQLSLNSKTEVTTI